MKKYLLLAVTALIFTPTITLAQKYLVDLPIDTQGNFNQYINLLYKMSISIAALLAVVKKVIAGAKYMLSDVVTNKSDAKKDIQGALLGLLLILGAVVILNTINPALTDGGLNITKVKNVRTSEDRLSPVAAAQQQGASLTADLPKCISQVSSLSKDGSKKLTTIDVSGCPVDQGLSILRDFSTNCVAVGGTADSNGSGSKKVTCSVPLPAGKEFKGYTSAEYSNIDQNFIQKAGNIVTLNADGQCQKQVSDSGVQVGTQQQSKYNLCMSLAKIDFKEYCGDDNGGNYSEKGTSYTCQLPIRRAYLSDLTKELEQYKSTLPTNDFTGRGITNANNASEEVIKAVCKIWGGEYRDIDGSENICVSF